MAIYPALDPIVASWRLFIHRMFSSVPNLLLQQIYSTLITIEPCTRCLVGYILHDLKSAVTICSYYRSALYRFWTCPRSQASMAGPGPNLPHMPAGTAFKAAPSRARCRKPRHVAVARVAARPIKVPEIIDRETELKPQQLRQYFERINLPEKLRNERRLGRLDSELLSAIVKGHVMHIPFENLSLVISRRQA